MFPPFFSGGFPWPRFVYTHTLIGSQLKTWAGPSIYPHGSLSVWLSSLWFCALKPLPPLAFPDSKCHCLNYRKPRAPVGFPLPASQSGQFLQLLLNFLFASDGRINLVPVIPSWPKVEVHKNLQGKNRLLFMFSVMLALCIFYFFPDKIHFTVKYCWGKESYKGAEKRIS